MAKEKPKWIAWGTDEFAFAVGDVRSRYTFELDDMYTFKDVVGKYTSVSVLMRSKKDPSETRGVLIDQAGAVAFDIPWYAQHKCAVYIAAAMVELYIDAPDWDMVMVLQAMLPELCAKCGDHMRYTKYIMRRSGLVNWVTECAHGCR